MPICNKDFDVSERKQAYQQGFSALVTGSTYVVSFLPNNGVLTGVFAEAIGISNTPVVSFSIYRFNNGTTLVPFNGATTSGFTAISLGVTVAVSAFGTSGWNWFGATINGLTTANAIGNTCQVYTGDLLVAMMNGTNASVVTAIVGGVVQATDDLLHWPG